MKAENADYKGYRIIASAEQDGATDLWNGRYRILDDKGIVAYESFTTSLKNEDEALEAANTEARAWIDGDTAELSGPAK